MSTTKEIKQKVKASSLEERISRLEELKYQINSVECDIAYWKTEGEKAEDNSDWWRTCWKNYNRKQWLWQKLHEIAEEV